MAPRACATQEFQSGVWVAPRPRGSSGGPCKKEKTMLLNPSDRGTTKGRHHSCSPRGGGRPRAARVPVLPSGGPWVSHLPLPASGRLERHDGDAHVMVQIIRVLAGNLTWSDLAPRGGHPSCGTMARARRFAHFGGSRGARIGAQVRECRAIEAGIRKRAPKSETCMMTTVPESALGPCSLPNMKCANSQPW